MNSQDIFSGEDEAQQGERRAIFRSSLRWKVIFIIRGGRTFSVIADDVTREG